MQKSGSPPSKIEYRLRWARTRLKHIGALVNSSWGVWVLTERGRTLTEDQMERMDKERWSGVPSTPTSKSVS